MFPSNDDEIGALLEQSGVSIEHIAQLRALPETVRREVYAKMQETAQTFDGTADTSSRPEPEPASVSVKLPPNPQPETPRRRGRPPGSGSGSTKTAKPDDEEERAKARVRSLMRTLNGVLKLTPLGDIPPMLLTNDEIEAEANAMAAIPELRQLLITAPNAYIELVIINAMIVATRVKLIAQLRQMQREMVREQRRQAQVGG